MEKTLFEKIIDREIPAEIVYEDDHTLAFLDIAPVNPGHTLVLPKKHSRNILEADAADAARVMETIQKIARALMQTGADGVNVIFNNESAAGQLVFHTHAHVIPRYASDGFHGWPQGKYEGDQMKELGEKIRSAIE